MNFQVDAQLPRRVCAILAQHGHNAIHTRELPTGNATKDSLINEISVNEQRVVVSKDSDFFYSHVLHGRPWKLLLIKTGNLSAQALCALLERNLSAIETVLETHTLIEIDQSTVKPVL